MKNLSYLFILLAIVACKSQKSSAIKTATDNKTLLWQVSGNGLKTPTHLFGTFHLMCKEDVAFGENVELAIKEADKVYFEMKLDDPSILLGGIFMMNMKDGKKISDLYTAEEFAVVSAFFKERGIPISTFPKMKPMMLESFLYPGLLGCENVSGVEQELMVLVKKEKKEIFGFETLQQQASVFDSIPYAVQAKGLYNTIDSFKQYKEMFENMVVLYKNQDLAALQQDLDKSSAMAEYNDILLYDRNKNWVEQLKKLMPTESIFVAVGAGHLPGEQGLISLLRKAGYTVKPVENKKTTITL